MCWVKGYKNIPKCVGYLHDPHWDGSKLLFGPQAQDKE